MDKIKATNYITKNLKSMIAYTMIPLIISFMSIYIISLVPKIIDEGVVNKNYDLLISNSIIILIIYCFMSILEHINFIVSVRLGNKLIYAKRTEFMDETLRSDLLKIKDYDPTNIGMRLAEISGIGNIFSMQIPHVITTFIESLIATTIMFNLNFHLALITSIFIPVIIFIGIIRRRKYEEISSQSMNQDCMFQSSVVEAISSQEKIRENNTLEVVAKKMLEESHRQLLLNEKRLKISKSHYEVALLIRRVIEVYIYVVAGMLTISGELSIGTFFSFSLLVNKYLSFYFLISNITFSMVPVIAIYKRIFTFKEYIKKKNSCSENQLIKYIDRIELKKVNFSYGENNVLDNLNLVFIKGNKYLIRGMNGAGKTTLLKIILKQIDYNEGDILFNNINQKTISSNNINELISYMPQKLTIVTGTVLDNVSYGFESYNIDHIFEIMEQLNIDYKRNNCNCEIDKLVGHNGSKLSGGEIQKINLARLFIKKSKVYILDEPTTNLDLKSVKILEKFLSKLDENCIVILSDHSGLLSEICNVEIEL